MSLKPTLRLGPIPDRTPVKVRLSLAPDVHDALADYAALHAKEFGRAAPVAVLASLMIEQFLEGDANFKRARKSLRPLTTAKE